LYNKPNEILDKSAPKPKEVAASSAPSNFNELYPKAAHLASKAQALEIK
jgi:hypothetical protein